VPDVVEALIEVYREQRHNDERFVDTARRLGTLPFRHAADAVRRSTAAVHAD
jgi:sulfite reductase (NADPH) hemoprotein beta-component